MKGLPYDLNPRALFTKKCEIIVCDITPCISAISNLQHIFSDLIQGLIITIFYKSPQVNIRFNTDQVCQFTSQAFTGALKSHGITINMDGRGRALDNIFVERL